MTSSSGDTTTKRIQLKVESGAPQLAGLDSTIGKLAELNLQLVAAGALSGRLRANLGNPFSEFSAGAQSAASRVKSAMQDSLAATDRVKRAVTSMSNIPGVGRLSGVNRTFASEGNFKAGDPSYRQEIFKSRGRTVKRSTVDNENFQYQESVNIDKFWDDAVKAGEKQRQRDLKAQQLWREHNRTWADIRAQKDVQQEVLQGSPISARGGNSQTSINAQAAAAQRDAKENERLQTQQADRDAKAQRLWREHNQKWKSIRADARHDRMGRDESFEEQLNRIRGRGVGVQDKVDDAYKSQARENARNAPPSSKNFLAGFAGKIGTAATWLAAYTALHKLSDLTVYSYQRMQQLDLQGARLSQVFRGVGGSATQLADDTLKLAAAEGRSTDEAMASAIAWSRLGLTRREVNEATKVSLMAANVAEIGAADATQSLSSIMSGFNMQVSQLAPTLGILNQQSNTYKITVAELLQGLSRVSGIARQAGFSFAELTGIITVSAQKSGQTGVNMSNALKTTLVRMNRSDVHDFFEKRYATNLTGSASDLEKVWEIYSRVNKEQQRDILLKVAGATQANRLNAIFETYSESAFAAVDSLTHLNSAELENLKITNTVAAAATRVSASWDRMIQSTSSGGIQDLFRGVLNTTSGVISGVTGTGANRPGSAQYFNPDLATGAGSLFGAANLVTGGLAGGFAKGLYATFDRKRSTYEGRIKDFNASYWASLGFTDTPTTQDAFHRGEIDKINALVGREEAGKDKADILEGLAKNYKSFSPEVKARERAVLATGHRVSQDTLEKLDAGDTSGLMAEAKAARDDSAKAHHDEVLRVRANLADRQRDLTNTPADESAKRLELEDQINELKRQDHRLFQEETDAAKDQEKTLYAIEKSMAAQKEYAQAIAGIFKGIGLNDYQQKILSLQYSIAQTDLMAKAIAEKEPDAADHLSKKAEELKAELDALNKVSGLDLAQRDAGVATQLSAVDVESHGVGLSDGDKLLDRRKYIAQEMAKLTDLSKDSTNDLLRYEVLLNAARDTQLKLSQRILEVDKERKQTAIDTQREFQKSIIGAGPGELLRKLAESQLAGKNGSRIKTAGQFFSLTGQSQRDIYDLMGGERMASLNAEARVLRGRGQSVDQSQKTSDAIVKRSMEVAAEYAKRIFPNGNAMSPPVVAQATKSVSDLATQTVRAVGALAAFEAKLNSFNPNSGNSNTSRAPSPSATPVPQGSPAITYNDYENSLGRLVPYSAPSTSSFVPSASDAVGHN